MASIVFDEAISKYNLPTWRVQGSQYPGTVSLEAIPWKGKLKSWLKGVAMPLPNFSPRKAASWEEFIAAKHYRTDEGIISVTGALVVLIDQTDAVPITDEVELQSLYAKRLRETRTVEVSAEAARNPSRHGEPNR